MTDDTPEPDLQRIVEEMVADESQIVLGPSRENVEQASRFLHEALAYLQLERARIETKSSDITDETQAIAVCIIHHSVLTDCRTITGLLEEMTDADVSVITS
jgi:hypothetical protein